MSCCRQNACKRNLKILSSKPHLYETDAGFGTRAWSAQTVPGGKWLGRELTSRSPQVLHPDPWGLCLLQGLPRSRRGALRLHTQVKQVRVKSREASESWLSEPTLIETPTQWLGRPRHGNLLMNLQNIFKRKEDLGSNSKARTIGGLFCFQLSTYPLDKHPSPQVTLFKPSLTTVNSN